jgi:hypothetical protein
MAIQDKILGTCRPDPQIFLNYLFKSSRSVYTREIDLFTRNREFTINRNILLPLMPFVRVMIQLRISFLFTS